MSERIFAPTRDDYLREYAELVTFGVAHIDIARRLGVTVEQMDTWLKSAETTARRRGTVA